MSSHETNLTENELLQMLQSGDKRAFEVLFLRYQPQLVMFIAGFIKDKEKARDFAQDIFLKIWDNRNDLGNIISFKGYLFHTARFAIYNFFDHELVDQKFVAEAMRRSQGDVYNAEEEYFVRELDEMIDLAISHMPDQRRRVFEMSRKQGLSNQEIADILHISKHTVERHISTSLAELRILKKQMIFLFFV